MSGPIWDSVVSTRDVHRNAELGVESASSVSVAAFRGTHAEAFADLRNTAKLWGSTEGQLR